MGHAAHPERGEVPEHLDVPLRRHGPSDADAGRLQALRGGADDEQIAAVDVVDVREGAHRLVVEKLVGLVDEEPEAVLRARRHERREFLPGSRHPGRVARIAQQHQGAPFSRSRIGRDRRPEPVVHAAVDEVIGASQPLEDIVVRGVFRGRETDLDIGFEEEEERHDRGTPAREHHHVLRRDLDAVRLTVVGGDRLPQRREPPRLGVFSVVGGHRHRRRKRRAVRQRDRPREPLAPRVRAGLAHVGAEGSEKGVEGLVDPHRGHVSQVQAGRSFRLGSPLAARGGPQGWPSGQGLVRGPAMPPR